MKSHMGLAIAMSLFIQALHMFTMMAWCYSAHKNLAFWKMKHLFQWPICFSKYLAYFFPFFSWDTWLNKHDAMRKYEKKSQCFTYDNTFGARHSRNKGQLRQSKGALILGTTHSSSMSVPLDFPMPCPLKIFIVTKNWLLNAMTKNPI